MSSSHDDAKMAGMEDRSAIAWLARRVGFGLAPGQLDALAALGVGGVLDLMFDPDGHGAAPAPDPWDHLHLEDYDPKSSAQVLRRASVDAWLAAMLTTPRPLQEWVRWFWHGHFV